MTGYHEDRGVAAYHVYKGVAAHHVYRGVAAHHVYRGVAAHHVYRGVAAHYVYRDVAAHHVYRGVAAHHVYRGVAAHHVYRGVTAHHVYRGVAAHHVYRGVAAHHVYRGVAAHHVYRGVAAHHVYRGVAAYHASRGVAVHTGILVVFAGPRSLAFDGKFIYITSTSLNFLLKLGSGKKGTIKGLVYASRELDRGWLLHVSGHFLLCRLASAENNSKHTFSTLSTDTLEVCAVSPSFFSSPPPVSSCTFLSAPCLVECHYDHHVLCVLQVCSQVMLEGEMPADILQTFQFMSDGKDVFWLYGVQAPTHLVTGEKIKQHPIYLQTLHIKVKDRHTCCVV